MATHEERNARLEELNAKVEEVLVELRKLNRPVIERDPLSVLSMEARLILTQSNLVDREEPSAERQERIAELESLAEQIRDLHIGRSESLGRENDEPD